MSSETKNHPDQQGNQPVAEQAAEQSPLNRRSPDDALVESYSEAYSGPLPDPKSFYEYGQVVPDAPERILRMTEKEQQEYFGIIVPEEVRFQRFGQWFGVGATAGAFIIAVIALLIGESTVAIVALTCVVASTILHIFKR